MKMANDNRNQNQVATIKQRTAALETTLEQKLDRIYSVLPVKMRDREVANQFIGRALSYFVRKTDVQSFSEQSIVYAILCAAECGLALDGKLAHIVKFGGEATLSIDWKGLVAIAKRNGHIYDAYADTVHDNDEFQIGRVGPNSTLIHQPAHQKRGNVKGAYAILKFHQIDPRGEREWRYEYLTREDLDKVKNAAPSQNGPWKTWFEEMCKKSAIRRALKSYSYDNELSKAMEFSDKGDGYTFDVEAQPVGRAAPTTLNLPSRQGSNMAAAAALTGESMQEPIDIPPPKQERREYDSTPRGTKRTTQQTQQQDPPAEENPDAEPPEETTQEPKVKLSKNGEKWMKWIDSQTESTPLENALEEVKDRTDLTDEDKPVLTAAFKARIKKVNDAPPGTLFETRPHA
jgi:phage RecT family recombinase